MRTSLLIFIFASIVFGGAWWTQARAAGASAAVPRGVDSLAPPVPAPTRAIDEYGNISWNDERARLDNLAIELQNGPSWLGHITCYGGRLGRRGEARRRCERAKNYISGYRGIPAERILTLDGGYREELTVVLWAIPPGVTPPQPSPTVDPREVRFVRGKAKRRPRSR